jgi:hypothetical protein
MFCYSYFLLCFSSQHLHICKSLTQKAEPPNIALNNSYLKRKCVFNLQLFPNILVKKRFWKLLTKNFKSRCSFRGCNTSKTRLDRVFHLTFFIVINVNWLKRPTYDKRITLICKLFPEILEVTNEGSSQRKSQPPYWKWHSSTFGSLFSGLLKKKSTYI